MEAPVLSVLNANYLSPENIKPEVISINDEDLKNFKYLANYQRQTKMYVPIQGGNMFEQFKCMETINIPKQIVKYIYDNPQNNLLQSILEVEFTSLQMADKLEQSPDILNNYLQQNNKLERLKDKGEGVTQSRLDNNVLKHCTCCQYFKNPSLLKFKSEPNIKLLFNQNLVCCDNNYYEKQMLFTKMVDDSRAGGDNYTEVDGKSLKRLRNNEVSVKQLSCDINQLMYKNAVMCDDLKMMKRGYQVENDRVTKLIKTTQELTSDLKEVKYLDDLISMLEGQLEKINTRRWPFKIIDRQNKCKNFIV